ncbi:hypothetical protein RI543_000463 [Arxiozyma heterogenica]|uniref:Uncharacterized protein n=1 Tax=Arxiozyma heterogenica TaxID=278026 RepID=A0AAN7WQR9_9SACH|nr:hypothetical protein RI543_000463 [Kazachstania heterogenica]
MSYSKQYATTPNNQQGIDKSLNGRRSKARARSGQSNSKMKKKRVVTVLPVSTMIIKNLEPIRQSFLLQVMSTFLYKTTMDYV